MKQLTIRGMEPELVTIVKDLARSEGISLNQAALRILRRGAGLDRAERADRCIGAALAPFVGTWTEEEAAEFDAAIESLGFNRIDEELWG